ncbi:hypothetical protein L8X40_04160 [Campylobacter sp. CNRCH_2013_0855]|uniref:hypothetical protein n=1 Tax=Campylobacter sp. CNRCH_2013_0855 TaxID=2911600 RepID=UPI0021E64D43|nr:hypothetical protein [Campylobacter sp. CNRCH_2013_0855]MCV3551715.1 hypothetical protein [Campylobacter sp. CNRCH_2013_0855]
MPKEKIISEAPDVQGLRVLVLSRAMETAGSTPVQAGFLTSISGLKGGSRESQKLSPINDRDYEEINAVGKKTSATVNMSLLYKFVKDGKTQDFEGVNYLEKAFEENEEVFIIVEVNDERKTTLKIKMKITGFEVTSEANNKFSANVTAEKIGEAKDITPFRFEEGDNIEHTSDALNVGDVYADKKSKTIYYYPNPSTLKTPQTNDERLVYIFDSVRGVCPYANKQFFNESKEFIDSEQEHEDKWVKEDDENIIHEIKNEPTQGQTYEELKGKTIYFYPNPLSLTYPANKDIRKKYTCDGSSGVASSATEEEFNINKFTQKGRKK